MSLRSTTDVRIGPQGRVIIPSAMRKSMDLKPGDTLTVRVEDDRLVFEKPDRILARLQAKYRTVPRRVSMVDELIAERRAEATKETGA